jgi:hypothetical protein
MKAVETGKRGEIWVIPTSIQMNSPFRHFDGLAVREKRAPDGTSTTDISPTRKMLYVQRQINQIRRPLVTTLK